MLKQFAQSAANVNFIEMIILYLPIIFKELLLRIDLDYFVANIQKLVCKDHFHLKNFYIHLLSFGHPIYIDHD